MHNLHVIPYRRYTGNGQARVRRVRNSSGIIYGVKNIKKKFTDTIVRAKQEIRIIAHPQFLSPDIQDKTHLLGTSYQS